MVPKLPACGTLTSGGPGDGLLEEAWDLTARALADAHEGRCNRVLAVDDDVADRDRAHHDDVFEVQPDIAACLTRGLVRDQIASTVRERVQRCAPLLPGGGTIGTKLSIAPRGKVTSASITGGESELAACVQAALEHATFPATELGGETTIVVDLAP